MTALGQLFVQHVPRDRYDDEGHPVGTYCICGGWEGDYFADGEAGPFDEHLADVVVGWLAGRALDSTVVEATSGAVFATGLGYGQPDFGPEDAAALSSAALTAFVKEIQ